MKFTMTKIAAVLALSAMAAGAQADAVTGMTLADVISSNNTVTTADDFLGSDGRSGAFRFSPISAGTYTGASLFGPANGGAINVDAATAPTEWTNGFVFAGSPFQPFTTGAIDADITGGVLTINSLPFAGYYVGADFVFNMTPDSYTVYNLIQTGATDYAYRIGFSHYITEQDDPSLTYVGFTAHWMLEGMMSTAPIPEASTYGMMLAGLGLVGMAVRRRRVML